jgi:rSAM/selenodomain-associated transferase 2
MPAELSIVVPTLNATHRIGPCLGALSEALGEGLVRELILADGGSSDGIEAVADAVGARLVKARRGRGTQLAAGVRAARGRWLLVVHADTVLAPGWAGAVRRHMAQDPDRAGHFRLEFDHGGLPARMVAGWANFRARWLGLPYGDQGLLISRTLYDAVGGYPELPLMEDVELARALRGRLRPIPLAAVTSAERYLAEGWVQRGLRNWGVMLRWMAGVPAEALAARYEGRRNG